MPRVKQASKQKRTTKAAAVKVLGATGLSFSLVGSASASTMPTAGIPQSDNTSPNQRFVLSEEEMADVSLATFYVFDKENVGRGVQEARGCGGCRAVAGAAAAVVVAGSVVVGVSGSVAAEVAAAAVAGSVASGSVAARLAWAARLAGVAAARGERAACAKSTKSAVVKVITSGLATRGRGGGPAGLSSPMPGLPRCQLEPSAHPDVFAKGGKRFRRAGVLCRPSPGTKHFAS